MVDLAPGPCSTHAPFIFACVCADIISDTSGDFRRLLLAILKCDRTPVHEEVDMDQANADAEILYKAGA